MEGAHEGVNHEPDRSLYPNYWAERHHAGMHSKANFRKLRQLPARVDTPLPTTKRIASRFAALEQSAKPDYPRTLTKSMSAASLDHVHKKREMRHQHLMRFHSIETKNKSPRPNTSTETSRPSKAPSASKSAGPLEPLGGKNSREVALCSANFAKVLTKSSDLTDIPSSPRTLSKSLSVAVMERPHTSNEAKPLTKVRYRSKFRKRFPLAKNQPQARDAPSTRGFVNNNEKELQEAVEARPDDNENREEVNMFLTEVAGLSSDYVHQTTIVKAMVDGMQKVAQNGEQKATIHGFNQVLKLAFQLDDMALVALMYHHIGNAFKELSDSKYAIQMQKQCINYAKQCQDRRLEARGYKGLGVAYMRMNDFTKALQYELQAINMAQSLHDYELEARAQANVGNIYRLQGKFVDSIQRHQVDLHLSKELDTHVGLARAHYNLSLSYKALGNSILAQSHLEKAQSYNHDNTQALARDMLHHPDTSVGNIYMQVTHPSKQLVELLKTTLGGLRQANSSLHLQHAFN